MCNENRRVSFLDFCVLFTDPIAMACRNRFFRCSCFSCPPEAPPEILDIKEKTIGEDPVLLFSWPSVGEEMRKMIEKEDEKTSKNAKHE